MRDAGIHLQVPDDLRREARYRLALEGKTLTEAVLTTLRQIVGGRVQAPADGPEEVAARIQRATSRDPEFRAYALDRYRREFGETP